MRIQRQKLLSSENGKTDHIKKAVAAALLALFVLSCVFFLIKMQRNDPQSLNSFPLPVNFSGEYRQGDGQWQELTGSTSFNALKGDLYLRGTLDRIVNTVPLYLFLDHISIEIYIDGELYYPDYSSDDDLVCDSRWISISMPEDMQVSDELEIHLTNNHVSGNPQAYTHFLRNIYFMQAQSFEQYILSTGYLDVLNFSELTAYVPDALFILYGPICQSVGKALMLLSILLLGFALLDLLHTALFGYQLLAVSLLSLLFSVSMQFNGSSINPSMDSALLASNIVMLLEMIIAVLLLVLLSLQLTGRRRMFSGMLTILTLAAVWVIILGHLISGGSLCENSWGRPVFFFLVLLAGVVMALEDLIRTKRITSFALSVLFLALLFEKMNRVTGWLVSGAAYRLVFLVEFILFMCGAVLWLPRQLREAARVARMEKEVQQSRVSIALSQIQPHFLFNSLNVIQYLCHERPEEAYEAVGQLSLYLRENLDVLSRDTLVPFAKELEHTKAYLHLEKLRFEDKLNVEWDLTVMDFSLPALTVQPLVENAVKHGICKTREGGTVTISTRRNGKTIEIVIEDNGAGFDPDKAPDDHREHVGIKNVRTRLEMMSHAVLVMESQIGVVPKRRSGCRKTVRKRNNIHGVEETQV